MHKGNRTASENGSEADVYYGIMNSQQKLPYRSFAPELFDDGKMIFDKSTDVWAYGITLIEMYRLGSMPYPTIANPQELMHFFTLGKIHAKPHLCPKDMYANIIQACFSIKKRDRPTFSMLAMQLKQIELGREVCVQGCTNSTIQYSQEGSKILVQGYANSDKYVAEEESKILVQGYTNSETQFSEEGSNVLVRGYTNPNIQCSEKGSKILVQGYQSISWEEPIISTDVPQDQDEVVYVPALLGEERLAL